VPTKHINTGGGEHGEGDGDWRAAFIVTTVVLCVVLGAFTAIMVRSRKTHRSTAVLYSSVDTP
jgi:hypothetical protein